MTTTKQPSATTSLRVISGDDVHKLDLDSVVSTQHSAFLGLSSGEALLGPRVLLPGDHGSVVFSYAARSRASSTPVTKFGCVAPANAGRGLPVVSAVVVALDAVTGQPAALVNGEAVTEVRTVATSMLAVQALATPTPRRVAVLGSGIQGRLHVRAIRQRYPDVEVRLCSPFDPGLSAFVAELATESRASVTAAETVREAVLEADVVLACTTAHEPIIHWPWLSPGATVISIGGFAPDRAEVDVDTVAHARVVVDDVETAVTQAGAVVAALTTGRLSRSDLISLGDVLTSERSPRVAADEVVLFNSVGLGVQDAALVDLLLRRCQDHGWGFDVAL